MSAQILTASFGRVVASSSLLRMSSSGSGPSGETNSGGMHPAGGGEGIKIHADRAAVNLTAQLLEMYGQGKGKAGQLSKHSTTSLQG